MTIPISEETPSVDRYVTISTLAAHLAPKTGFSTSESAAIITQIFTLITEALQRGESVKVSGVGHFVMEMVPEREGYNVQLGAKATQPAHPVLKFRAARSLRLRICQRSIPDAPSD